MTNVGANDATGKSSEADAVREAMGAIHAILGHSEGGLEPSQDAFFEYLVVRGIPHDVMRDAPVVRIMTHIGNYWRAWLLVIIQSGSYRPSALRKLLMVLDREHPISQRMLTLNLRLLERDGLITRKVIEDGRHVEYSLTSLGADLCRQIMSLIEWINANVKRIDD